jgi:copper chaperone CopZ
MKAIKSTFVLLSILFSAQLFANSTLKLSVKGMHCGGCETKFKTVAADVKGVTEVTSVSASNSNAVIVFDEKTTSSEQIVKTLAEKTGYTVAVTSGAAVTSATENRQAVA